MAVIAFLGLVMLVGYAVWLVHKGADVLSELKVLGRRAEQLGELAGQVRIPAYTRDVRSGTVGGDEDSWAR